MVLAVGLLARSGASAPQHHTGVAAPAGSLSGAAQRHASAYALTVDTVRQKIRTHQELILVDVRRRADFEKVRIPGSLNIPLFALKTKAFLKAQPLVLINEGYHYSPLERACTWLRKSGFKVWILSGGLSYWRKTGGPLEGDVFAQKALNRIPPRVFFVERGHDNWVVIDVSAARPARAHTLIPHVIPLPYGDDKEKFVETLKAAVPKSTHNRFLPLLLCNEKGEHYDHIETVVQKAGFKHIFFLKGGLEAYEKFLEHRELMRSARLDRRKASGKCPHCP